MGLAYNQESKLKLVVNVVVLVIAFISIFSRDFSVRDSSPIEKILINLFAPAQKQVAGVKNYFSSIIDHYFSNITASKDNVLLSKEIDKLKSKMEHNHEVLLQNMRLKSMLKFSAEVKYNKIVARIVATDSSSDYRVLRIDQGMIHGVRLQSAVLSPKGVVGYVYRLTNNYADVLTITDSNNRIDAIVKRIRVHGIVEGHNDQKTIMKYISRTEPIVLGDQILTSGLGNIYPKGLVVGEVTRIERASYGITQEIEITPTVDFSALEEVFVLVEENNDNKKEEWKALEDLGMEENKR